VADGHEAELTASMGTPPTQYVTTSDDVRIAYLRVGRGSPVVFASNFGGDAHNYHVVGSEPRGLTDRLVGAGWEVIRYDTRGMGSSDRDVTDWSLDARVRDLEAVVQRIGVRPFAVIGIDQGSPTAIAFAEKHPSIVSRLILLCPWAHGEARYALPSLRIAMAGLPSTDGPAWEVLTNVIANAATHFGDPPRAQRIAASIRNAMSADTLRAYLAGSRAFDVRPLLPRVTVPTLVLHEARFPFGSFELCKEVASGIPDAHLMTVNDGAITGNSYDQTVPAIRAFLGDPGGAAATRHAKASALTPREEEVLRLIAAGRANKEIATALAMSERTVARHITNLYAKLGTRSKAEATAYALRNGLS